MVVSVHDLIDLLDGKEDLVKLTSSINLYFHGTCKTIEEFTIRIVELTMLENYTKNGGDVMIKNCITSHKNITKIEFEKMLQDSNNANILTLFSNILRIKSLEPDYFQNSKIKIIEIAKPLNSSSLLLNTHKEFINKLQNFENLNPPYYYKDKPEELENWVEIIDEILYGIEDVEFLDKFIQPLKVIRNCFERFHKNNSKLKVGEIPKASFCGIDLPFFLINHTMARKLSCIQKDGTPKKPQQNSTHPVYVTNNVYFKLNLTNREHNRESDWLSSNARKFLHPECEFAVSSLYNILGFGKGVAATVLLKINNVKCPDCEYKYLDFFVQASEQMGNFSAKDILHFANLPLLFSNCYDEEKGKELFSHISNEWESITKNFNNLCRKQICTDENIVKDKKYLNQIIQYLKENENIEFHTVNKFNITSNNVENCINILALKYYCREFPLNKELIVYKDIYLPFTEVKKLFLSPEQAYDELIDIWNKFKENEFCVHFIVTILTNQKDHKPENIRVSLIQNKITKEIESCSFVGIDNDQAFIMESWSITTIFFNLPFMNNKISKEFINSLKLMPGKASLIIKWICTLQELNRKYERFHRLGILNPIEIENFAKTLKLESINFKTFPINSNVVTSLDSLEKKCKYLTYLSVPIELDEYFLRVMYAKISALFDNLEKLDDLTYWQLFEIMQHDIYSEYVHVKQNKGSLIRIDGTVPITKNIEVPDIDINNKHSLDQCIERLFINKEDNTCIIIYKPIKENICYFSEKLEILDFDYLTSNLSDKLFITEKLLSGELIRREEIIDRHSKFKKMITLLEGDFNYSDELREDIFFKAVSNGYLQIVAKLVSYQNKNSKKLTEVTQKIKGSALGVEKTGPTGFLLACSTLHREMINLLLQNRSDPRTLYDNKTALYILILKYNQAPQIVSSIIRDLSEQKNNFKILWNKKCGKKNKTVLHKLVEKIVKPDKDIIIGKEPLIEFMVDKGCYPDWICQDETSLDIAIKNNKNHLINQLIYLGAGRNLNVKQAKIYFNDIHSNFEKKQTFTKLLSNSLYLRWILTLESFEKNILSNEKSSFFIKLIIDTGDAENKIKTIEKYIPDNIASKLFDKDGNIIDLSESTNSIRMGKRKVNRIAVQLDNYDDEQYLYIKQDPESPGIEYAVNRLLFLLIGHGTSFSTIGYIKYKKNIFPILISQGIGAKNPTVLNSIVFNKKARQESKISERNSLVDQIMEDKKLEDNLDRRSFSELFLASLLVNYEDGKPDNFIVDEIQCKNEIKKVLVCIDNDHSFLPPFIFKKNKSQQMQSLEEEKQGVLVKNIIFCFSLMQEEIHPMARERFLSLSTYEILSNWLRDVQERNILYSEFYEKKRIIFKNKYDNEKLCPFRQGSIGEIYQKIKNIQLALKEPKITLLEIFKIVIPTLGSFYEHAFRKELPTIFHRFNYIAGIHYDISDDTRVCSTMLSTKESFKYMEIKSNSCSNDGKIERALKELHEIAENLNYTKQRNSDIIKKLTENEDISNTLNELDKVSSEEKGYILEKLNFSSIPLESNQIKIIDYFCKQNLENFNINYANKFDGSKLKNFISKSRNSLRILKIRGCESCKIQTVNELLVDLPFLYDFSFIGCNNISASDDNEQIILDLYDLPSLRRLTITNCNNIKRIEFGSQLRYLVIEDCSAVESLEAFTRIDPRESQNGIPQKKYKTNQLILSKLKLQKTNSLSLYNLFSEHYREIQKNSIVLNNFPLYFEDIDISSGILTPNTFSLKKLIINPTILKYFTFCKISFHKCSAMVKDIDVIKIISYCTTIDTLNLSCTQITNNLLKFVKNIENINLSSCNQITKKGLEKLLYYDHKDFQLNKLNLSNNLQIDKDSFSVFQNNNCISIKKLILSKCYNIDNIALSYLTETMTLCESIECLDLSFCKEISSDGVECISKLKNLKEINLSHCILITDNDLKVLSENCNPLFKIDLTKILNVTKIGIGHLSKCKNIEDLNISYSPISDDDFSLLLNNHFKVNQFKNLNLSRCSNLGNLTLQAIGNNCMNLQILNISYNDNFSIDGIQYISQCLDIYEVDFSYVKHFDDFALKELIRHKNEMNFSFKKLNFDCCSVTDDGIIEMFKLFEKNSAPVEEINLRNCNITNVAIGSIAQACRNLKKINLHYCKKVDDEAIAYLQCTCENLSEIICYNTNISDVGGKILFGFNELKVLDLHNCSINDECLVALTACSNITNLNMQNCSITDEGVEHLSKSCPQISIINLNSCTSITDEGIYYISQYCCKIFELSIANCNQITDVSLQLLAQNCFQISVLDLSSCKNITSEGLIAISKSCSQIKKINLSNCSEITDDGIKSLANHCPLIYSITLDNCEKLTDEAIVVLASKCLMIRDLNIKRVTNITATSLFSIARNCTGLSKINLCYLSSITDVGVIALAQGCSLLTVIKLSHCTISDEALDAINDYCSLLYKIDMESCPNITSQGVAKFGNRSAHFQNILELNCNCCDHVPDPAKFRLPK